MSLEEAEKCYLEWTNRLMTACRAKATRTSKKHPAPEKWSYAAVTERQDRGHPHSHILITYAPPDARLFKEDDTLPNGRVAKHDTLWSEWFRGQVVKSGLGSECEISPVANPVSASAYIAKYLFKSSVNTRWPEGWRRVRYSQNYPKLPRDKNPTAIALIKHADWIAAGNSVPFIETDSQYTYERALAHGVYNALPPRK